MGNFFKDVLGSIPIVGGVVNAAADLISGNNANKTNVQIANQNNQAQLELAKYQADRNLDLWNLNNEYNTPLAQMQRYSEAGLNPNLIYGNGSSSAGNSQAPASSFNAPAYQRAEVSNHHVVAAGQALMNGLMTASQVRKNDAETAQIHQNTENLSVDNSLKRLQEVYFRLRNSKTNDEADLWRDRLWAEIANMDARSVQARAGAQLADSQRFLSDAMRPLLLEEKRAQIASILENTLSTKQSNSLYGLKKKMLVNQIAEIASRAELNRTSGLLNDERRLNISWDSQIKSILVRSGLNLTNDELDRLEYQLMNGLGMNGFRHAKFGARLVKQVMPGK